MSPLGVSAVVVIAMAGYTDAADAERGTAIAATPHEGVYRPRAAPRITTDERTGREIPETLKAMRPWATPCATPL